MIKAEHSLLRRIQTVLIQLKMLAEGPVALLRKDRYAPSAEKNHRPRDPESLYEEFAARFERVKTQRELVKLCLEAETELSRWRGQHQPETELPTDEKAARERICVVYEGRDPIEVSRKMAGKVSPAWVRQARRFNRRDPENGKRLKGWRGLTEEEQTEAVQRAIARGKSVRQTASELGVHPSSLYRQFGELWS